MDLIRQNMSEIAAADKSDEYPNAGTQYPSAILQAFLWPGGLLGSKIQLRSKIFLSYGQTFSWTRFKHAKLERGGH
jgi:hypothetical protein